MNDPVCVDASVVVKTVIPEAGTETARALVASVLERGDRLVAPKHFEAELASAVHKRRRDGEITAARAHELLDALGVLPVKLVSPAGAVHLTLDIAAELALKYPYDVFYLAVGELLDCDVWTADERFHSAAAARYPRLKLLSDFRPERP